MNSTRTLKLEIQYLKPPCSSACCQSASGSDRLPLTIDTSTPTPTALAPQSPIMAIFPLDFFVVGAQKCATSWLYSCLAEHPDISLPRKKREIHYLGGPVHHQRGDSWFASRYSTDPSRLRGDVSVDYLEDPKSAVYLSHRFPDAKIIVSLRDPVDRAVSAYYWAYRKGVVHDSLDSTLLELVDDSTVQSSPAYDFLTRSCYSLKLRNFVQAFGRDKVFALMFERLRESPSAILDETLGFLGADQTFVPRALRTKPKRNSYSLPFIAIERRLGRNQLLRKVADLTNQLLAGIQGRPTCPPLSSALERSLQDFLRDDLRRLETLLLSLPKCNRVGFDSLREYWPTYRAACNEPPPSIRGTSGTLKHG